MFTSPQLAGISDFNFILAQNHMPATLWCQPQIALAAGWVANALVGQFRWLDRFLASNGPPR